MDVRTTRRRVISKWTSTWVFGTSSQDQRTFLSRKASVSRHSTRLNKAAARSKLSTLSTSRIVTPKTRWRGKHTAPISRVAPVASNSASSSLMGTTMWWLLTTTATPLYTPAPVFWRVHSAWSTCGSYLGKPTMRKRRTRQPSLAKLRQSSHLSCPITTSNSSRPLRKT